VALREVGGKVYCERVRGSALAPRPAAVAPPTDGTPAAPVHGPSRPDPGEREVVTIERPAESKSLHGAGDYAHASLRVNPLWTAPWKLVNPSVSLPTAAGRPDEALPVARAFLPASPAPREACASARANAGKNARVTDFPVRCHCLAARMEASPQCRTAFRPFRRDRSRRGTG